MKKYIIIILLFLIICYVYKFNYNKFDADKLYNSLVYVESLNNDKKIKGSGFVYKKNNNINYIVTNYHVIGSSNSVYVYDKNNNKSLATLIDYNELYDIALLSVESKDLKQIKLGNSDKLKVLDEIYVLGNPLGNQYFGTISKGIISYLDREIKVENINNVSNYSSIQIDASVNSGNSGGPLLDKNGKVVGIISIKESELEGVSFAIPINTVKFILDKMID